MMRRRLILLSLWLIVAGLVCLGQQPRAQLTMTGVGPGGFGAGGFTPSCTESSDFIARTSGQSDVDKTNYNALICGLVTDSAWTGIDVLQIYAAADATVAVLNLKSASFPAAATNAPTFTAYRGFTGITVSSSYIDTGFNGSTAGGAYVQDAASVGAWNTTAGVTTALVGLANTGSGENIYPKFADDNVYIRVNDSPEAGGFTNGADSTGFYLGIRTSATGRTGYRNKVSVGSYGSTTSTAPVSSNFVVPASNTLTVSAAQVSAFIAGGNLDSVQDKIYDRLRTYMTAVGVP